MSASAYLFQAYQKPKVVRTAPVVCQLCGIDDSNPEYDGEQTWVDAAWLAGDDRNVYICNCCRAMEDHLR